jgi:hypothetical protein
MGGFVTVSDDKKDSNSLLSVWHLFIFLKALG